MTVHGRHRKIAVGNQYDLLPRIRTMRQQHPDDFGFRLGWTPEHPFHIFAAAVHRHTAVEAQRTPEPAVVSLHEYRNPAAGHTQ